MRYPRIIVEGPDGAGKTTLIRKLVDHLDDAAMAPRACTSDNGPIATLKDWVNGDLGMVREKKTIYDRHPLISEPIYGPLIRGYIDPGLAHLPWLREAYNKFHGLSPIIIYCLPPYPIVHENILRTHKAATPHQEGVVRHAMAIYDSYTVLAASEVIRPLTMVWDYTQPEKLTGILDLVEA